MVTRFTSAALTALTRSRSRKNSRQSPWATVSDSATPTVSGSENRSSQSFSHFALASDWQIVKIVVKPDGPDFPWGAFVINKADLQIAPLEAMRLSHAAAIPASLLLLVTAPYLWRRRQSAFRLALVLLLGLGVLNLLKGLDVEEASASFALAGLLWLGRSSFCVQPDPVSLRAALRRIPLVLATGFLLCCVAVWLAAPETLPRRADAPEELLLQATGDG